MSGVLCQIALILQGAYNPCKKDELDQLVTEAIDVSGIACECVENPVFVVMEYVQQHAQAVLEHDDQKKELVTHVNVSKLKELDLENRKTMGYENVSSKLYCSTVCVPQCVLQLHIQGSGCWVLWSQTCLGLQSHSEEGHHASWRC